MTDLRCSCGHLLLRGVIILGRIEMKCTSGKVHEFSFGDVAALDKLCAPAIGLESVKT